MYSDFIQKLVDLFAKFPTVGPRTAQRFVFYLIKSPEERISELIKAIQEIRERIKICNFCGKPYEESQGKEGRCEICFDKTRDASLLCVVEKEEDLEAVEKTNKYKGLYFILGGTVSNFEKRKKQIEERVEDLANSLSGRQGGIREIILALNPTPEGENTSFWLERRLKPLNIKITRLARGLPKGGELEYADEETLASALEGRS